MPPIGRCSSVDGRVCITSQVHVARRLCASCDLGCCAHWQNSQCLASSLGIATLRKLWEISRCVVRVNFPFRWIPRYKIWIARGRFRVILGGRHGFGWKPENSRLSTLTSHRTIAYEVANHENNSREHDAYFTTRRMKDRWLCYKSSLHWSPSPSHFIRH